MFEEFTGTGVDGADNPDIAAQFPQAPRAVRRALDFIHANLASHLSLDDIATAGRMSVYHFSRTFRRATGTGPHRYLVQLRVERVKALLRNGDRSLAQIAGEAGFSDQSHMSKVFRRFTGQSPKAYRSAQRIPRCPLRALYRPLRGDGHAQ